MIAEGCTAEHHKQVKRTSEILKTAKWAVAAAPPGDQRRHFLHAMLQAKLVWASDVPDNFEQVLIELSQDQVGKIFRDEETFLSFAKSESFPNAAPTSTAASNSATSHQQQSSQLQAKKDLWPQLRHKTMMKLRQRLVDLRPYDIEQLCVLVDGLSLEAISGLVRTEGDLRQSVQALFPHCAIWAFTPSTQNPRAE